MFLLACSEHFFLWYPFYCSQQVLIVILCPCYTFKYFDYYDHPPCTNPSKFCSDDVKLFRSLIDLVVLLEEQEQNLLMPKQIWFDHILGTLINAKP